jgi:hypothetical protein
VSVLPLSELEERISWFIHGTWDRWRCFECLSFAFSSIDGGEI